MNILVARPPERAISGDDALQSAVPILVTIGGVYASVRRHALLIFAIGLIGILLAGVLILVLPKKYTATASVFIDFSHPAGLNSSQMPPLGLVDPAAVESQIDILESERIAVGAIKRLDLFSTPDLIINRNVLRDGLSWALRQLSGAGPANSYEIERSVIDAVRDNTTVARAGKTQSTFVLDISFDAKNAELASRVANALAATYLTYQLEARFETAKLANDWFNERLQEMSKSVAAAEEAAQKYRADNDITLVSDKGSMSLVDEQNLSDAESNLTTSRARLADSRSRLASISQIMSSGNPLAAVSATLDSLTIQRLRGEYADLMSRKADLEQRGTSPDHNVMRQIQAALAEKQRLVTEEFTRIQSSIQNEVSSTIDRIAQLEQQRSTIADSLKQTKARAVHAAELDREASAVRSIYEAFMSRFQVTMQEQSYPVSEARMLTSAEPPLKQSRRKLLILALGGVGGLLSAAAVTWLRENSGLIKSGQHLQGLIGAPFLGNLPRIYTQQSGSRNSRPSGELGGLLTYTMNQPMSAYTETLRRCKAAVQHERPSPAILGILSAVQGEGKSTFAANLASHFASSGYRTLLVDADTRNPELSAAVNKSGGSGLTQILTGAAVAGKVVQFDANIPLLAFVPSGTQGAIANIDELLTSPAFEQFLVYARENFQYVVFDLPPLAPVVDAEIISRQIDGLYFVARWNRTSASIVKECLQKSLIPKDRLVGGVLNLVPEHEIKQHYKYHKT
jgi:polysaccharide biosynthesis transport protein